MQRKNKVDILMDNLKKSYAFLALGHCWVFLKHDNPKHTSKLAQNLLKDTEDGPGAISILLRTFGESTRFKIYVWKQHHLDELEQLENKEQSVMIPQE